MSAVQAYGVGVLERALIETLGSIAEPTRAEAVMRAVLRRESLDGVPEDVNRFRQLIEGPLCGSVSQWLGADAAASMLEQLEPVMHRALSTVPPARPSRAPQHKDAEGTVRTPRTPSEPPRLSRPPRAKPLLLLLSTDERRAVAVAEAIEGMAQVRMVETSQELVAALNSDRQRTLIVLDDRIAPIDAETLEWIGTTVAAMPPVVLWGADAIRHTAIAQVAPSADTWMRVERRDAEILATMLTPALAELAKRSARR